MVYIVEYVNGELDKIRCDGLEAANAMAKDLVDLKLTKKCRITQAGE